MTYDDGVLMSLVQCQAGKLDGLSVGWNNKGWKEEESTRKDGKILSYVTFKPNGEKCSETNIANGNGSLVLYNDNGSVAARGTCTDGEVEFGSKQVDAPKAPKKKGKGKKKRKRKKKRKNMRRKRKRGRKEEEEEEEEETKTKKRGRKEEEEEEEEERKKKNKEEEEEKRTKKRRRRRKKRMKMRLYAVTKASTSKREILDSMKNNGKVNGMRTSAKLRIISILRKKRDWPPKRKHPPLWMRLMIPWNPQSWLKPWMKCLGTTLIHS